MCPHVNCRSTPQDTSILVWESLPVLYTYTCCICIFKRSTRHLKCSFNQTFVSALSQTAGTHRLEKENGWFKLFSAAHLGHWLYQSTCKWSYLFHQGNSKAQSALDYWLALLLLQKMKDRHYSHLILLQSIHKLPILHMLWITNQSTVSLLNLCYFSSIIKKLEEMTSVTVPLSCLHSNHLPTIQKRSKMSHKWQVCK